MSRVRFEVSVNGRVRCVAGLNQAGTLNALLNYWLFPPPETAWQKLFPTGPAEVPEGCVLEVNAEPLQGETESVQWLHESLRPGDEVTIRVLGPGDMDPPAR